MRGSWAFVVVDIPIGSVRVGGCDTCVDGVGVVVVVDVFDIGVAVVIGVSAVVMGVVGVVADGVFLGSLLLVYDVVFVFVIAVVVKC